MNITEIKLKELEMIQSIINRMANNSFLLKGWTITIIVGAISINGGISKDAIYLLMCASIVLLWLMDAYYLKSERQYRMLYAECVRREESDLKLQCISSKNRIVMFIRAAISITEMGFYISLLIIVTVIFQLK